MATTKQVNKIATSSNQFHIDVFAAVTTYDNVVGKAATTLASRLESLITKQYGEVAPTFEQFQTDRKALAVMAKAKGLASDQHVRKPYNKVILALYGALPVSMAPSAVAMRAKRDAAPKKIKVKVGAVKGETSKRVTSDKETVEQLVARVGVFAVLDACAKILAAEPATKNEAGVIRTLTAAAKQAA